MCAEQRALATVIRANRYATSVRTRRGAVIFLYTVSVPMFRARMLPRRIEYRSTALIVKYYRSLL